MTFEDLKLDPIELITAEVKLNCNGLTIGVQQYLPINDKAEFIMYVVNNAVDQSTGCFSPVRLNVFYSLAIVQWYAGVDISNIEDVADAYDKLDKYRIIEDILSAIPKDEREFIDSLVNDTIEDIARYNNSFAGMISTMTSDATNLDKSIQEILEKVKNKEGLEILSEIKNVVGKD